ncbi:MAG: galactose mutarotase [Synechococcus sp.]|nr:galactose mutarotase [Synechococcus sp.]
MGASLPGSLQHIDGDFGEEGNFVSLIQRETPYPHWEFSDPVSSDLLRVVPERGGLITGWRSGGHEVLYLDLERLHEPAQSVRGGMPVLFPSTERLPDNRLPLPQGVFNLGEYGFAQQLPWRLEELADGRGVQLQLGETHETFKIYPFWFLLTMNVRLDPGAMEITVLVENRGNTTMPFNFGLHPYFNLSSLESARFEGLPSRCFNNRTMQEASAAEQMNSLASGIDLMVEPTGPIWLVDETAGTTLELELIHPLDLVVLRTEPPRAMVCIQPWSTARQALVSGDRRLGLRPGTSTRFRTRYAFRAPRRP